MPGLWEQYYREDYYNYNGIFDLCDAITNDTDDRAVLDVGCGLGELLMQFYNSGMTNLTGCDPFVPEDIDYDGKIKIYKKMVHEMQGE